MANQSARSLATALKQMVLYCRELQGLLDADKTHFSSNAIKDVNESNQKKVLLIEKLNVLVSETYSHASPEHQSSGILELIEKTAENFAPAEKREIHSMLDEFKTEIANSYQHILVNSKIIFAGTQQLRLIWDKLQACRSEVESVYDNKGHTAK